MKGSSRKKKKRVKIDFRQEEEEREGKRREDVERDKLGKRRGRK